MRRKFKLKNDKGQHLAVVLYFYEEILNSNVGIIISNDLSEKSTWLFQNEQIEEVIADLARRLEIEYTSFEEVN
jgi:hypothetical protein